jgi:hypothetical protein
VASTVTIAGKHVPKVAVYGGIGVAVVGGVLWIRSRNSSAAAATAGTATAAADPSVDPATGIPYAQEAAAAGYGGGSGVGYGYPSGGGVYSTSAAPPAATYTDNASWAQAVEQGLTGLGYDPISVGAAIGKYLAKLPLTAAQTTIVQTAVAEYGPPPAGSFAIITTPGTVASGAAPGSAPGGFSVTPHAGFADFGWGTVPGATSYELTVTGAGGKGTGRSHADQVVSGTHVEHLALTPGAYHAQVRAKNATGAGPSTAARSFTVSK